VTAVKIIGIDNKGSSPGFDLVSVKALVGAIGPPPSLYLLSVNKIGTGSGKIRGIPLGINCSDDCEESYVEGTEVALSAIPESGSYFETWSGGECSGTGDCVVKLNSDMTITATFTSGSNCEGLYTQKQVDEIISNILCWGDTNNDGKIGLSEAIHALRVTTCIDKKR
ncbi:hypothetical protein MHK_006849, partial [Candidatus Magnetomorum sp. HK-1]